VVDLSDPDVLRRRRATVNRITTTFKAALNHAARMYPEQCPNRTAWCVGLRAFRNVETARSRWLDTLEIRRLLDACPPDFGRLVRAALYTGCRYGELRRAKVGDYHAGFKALRIPTSKSGRWRDVIVHDEAAAFFATITARRRPDEWLLTQNAPELMALRDVLAAQPRWSRVTTHRAIRTAAQSLDACAGTVAQHLALALRAPVAACVPLGRTKTLRRLDEALARPWGPSQQARRMAAACRRARIAPPISFHGLRHCYASLAVQSGMALIALAKNLGHTDTRMVEKHYGHLSDAYLRDQVGRHAPAFGLRCARDPPRRGRSS
jgi:integrase